MFWDKLKPTEREPRLLSMDVAENSAFSLSWEDGKKAEIRFRDLRLVCPCAACVDEWTGAKLLDPSQVRAHDLLCRDRAGADAGSEVASGPPVQGSVGHAAAL